MEYIDGEHCDWYGDDELRGKVFSCIDALEKLGFDHRSIKPANVLITKSGDIKIIDFGRCTFPTPH
jgi:serine/threonine protein kinase